MGVNDSGKYYKKKKNMKTELNSENLLNII